MKNKIVLLFVVACLLNALSFRAYSDPLADDYQTIGLWHFDTATSGITPDANPIRNNDVKLNVNGSGAAITTGSSGVYGEALDLGHSDSRALGAWQGYDSFKIELSFKQQIDTSRPVQQIFQLPGALSIWISNNWQLYVQVIDGSWNTVASVYALTLPDGDRPVWGNGSWTNMVAEYKNRVLTMTVNSKTITANAAAGLEMGHFNGDIYLGDPYNSGAKALSGIIDEVKISVPTLAAPTCFYPYSDSAGVLGLWHLNQIVNDSNYYTPDDDSITNRNNDLTLMSSDQIFAGTGDGPSLVSGDYPNNDPNFGSAMSFSGWGDHLAIGTGKGNVIGVSKSNFKAEAWAKLDSSIPNIGNFDQYYIVGQDNTWGFGFDDTASMTWWLVFYITVENTDGTTTIQGLNIPDFSTPYQWHHYSCEFYNGTMKVYVDGFLAGTRTISQSQMITIASSFNVGGSWLYGAFRPWAGLIDEVRLMPATLECGSWGYSQADINQDCYVNFEDLAVIMQNWLCLPGQSNCQ